MSGRVARRARPAGVGFRLNGAPEPGILGPVNQDFDRKKKMAAVVVILAALVAIHAGRNSKDRPHRSRQESGPIAEETRGGANSVPPAGTRAEVSRDVAARRADFDFYLLAMSAHRAVCADQERKPECRAPAPRPLVIHGLWPERLTPRAYPHDCPAPALDLEPALARELEGFMPGMSSGLHQHEWRTHGGCSGLGDDEYFQRALELARRVDAALAPELTTRAGQTMTPAELRAAADRFEAGLGATLTFHCRTPRAAVERGRPLLYEVRQCVDDDGANGGPGAPLSCASMNRRDQGCGQSFLVAAGA